MTKRAG